MKIIKNRLVLLFLILTLAGVARLYKLNEVPSGFHQDEASQAYNAYSLLKTGKDRYGQAFPILFRSLGSYQPPIYTYLATIPIALLGNTVFSARVVSAIAGVLSVLLTYLIIYSFSNLKDKGRLALIASLLLAISPWAIHFSRLSVEANVSLCLFILSFYVFLCSLKRNYLFLIACFLFGLTTHAYYSERIIAPVFLFMLVAVFHKIFLKEKKWLFIGFGILILTLIPHLYLIQTGAFMQRFVQVGSGGGKNIVIGNMLRHYLEYLSPKYLFSDSGNPIARVAPGLGVFYGWAFIPFLAGLYFLYKNRSNKFIYLILSLTTISLIPASLTGDTFYPLRALIFLWSVTLIISFGLDHLLARTKTLYTPILLVLITVCLIVFYYSYFILFKYENAKDFGYSYVHLSSYLTRYSQKHIVIDSARGTESGIRISYFMYHDPTKMQSMLKSQIGGDYYNQNPTQLESYKFNNIEVRPVIWGRDSCSLNTLLVGDNIAISEEQVKEHGLNLAFVIGGINGHPELFGYLASPSPCSK